MADATLAVHEMASTTEESALTTTARCAFPLLCALLALAAQAQPTPASPPAPAVSQPALPGVNVEGQHNPLTRHDRKLRHLKHALPELGGNPAPSSADRLRDSVARHADPEAATGEQRRMMENARRPEGPAPQ